MRKGPDFCRNLRAIAGIRGDVPEGKRRHVKGTWAPWRPVLPSCKLHLKLAPTVSVVRAPACELKQPRVHGRGGFGFTDSELDVISCLERQKGTREQGAPGSRTPTSQLLARGPASVRVISLFWVGEGLGITPRVQKRIHFNTGKHTWSWIYIYFYFLCVKK